MNDVLPFLKHHFLLSGSFGLTLLAWLFFEARLRLSGVESLSPAQLTYALNQDQAWVVDIREQSDFRAGHILGSVSVSAEEALAEPSRFLQRAGGRQIVLICQTGQRAFQYAWRLKQQHKAAVAVLQGGLQAWQNSQLPLSKA